MRSAVRACCCGKALNLVEARFHEATSKVAVLRFGKVEKASAEMQVTGVDETKTHDVDQGFDGGSQGAKPRASMGRRKVDTYSPKWRRANWNSGLIA